MTAQTAERLRQLAHRHQRQLMLRPARPLACLECAPGQRLGLRGAILDTVELGEPHERIDRGRMLAAKSPLPRVERAAEQRLRRARSRPLIATRAPARASSVAQARPRPRLDAQTIAVRPAMPRSIYRP